MHPDGSYGGEYGSRNTFHFYPHGFELLAPLSDKAGQIADMFLQGISKGKRYRNDDDRMTAHYAYDFLQSWEDRTSERPPTIKESRKEPQTIWLKGAHMIIARNGQEWQKQGGLHVVANLSKGGVLKVFDAQGPIASDTGVIGELDDGTVVVSHLVQLDNEIKGTIEKPHGGTWFVKGTLCKRRKNQMSVLKSLLLRLWCLLIGRFNANLTRSLVKKSQLPANPRQTMVLSEKLKYCPIAYVTDRLSRDTPFAD